MERTYGLPRRVVKGMGAYLSDVLRVCYPIATSVILTACPLTAWSQGLPPLAPLNPVASSRSGVYFQPLRDPAPGGWSTALSVEYGSLIEYNRLDHADYVLDSE